MTAHARAPKPTDRGNPFSSLPCKHCGGAPTKAISSVVKVLLAGTVIRRDRRCTRCHRITVTHEGYAGK